MKRVRVGELLGVLHRGLWWLVFLPLSSGVAVAFLTVGPNSSILGRFVALLGLALLCWVFGRRQPQYGIAAFCLAAFPGIRWILDAPETGSLLALQPVGQMMLGLLSALGLSSLWGLPAALASTALSVVFLGLGSGANAAQLLVGGLLTSTIAGFGAFFHWTFRQLEAAYGRLEETAMTDAMTGLGNRRRLEAEFDAFTAGTGPVLFTVWDLDDLKGVNDTLGHAAGDRYIGEFVRSLRFACGPNDRLYRAGGDEFIGLHAGLERVDDLLERVRASFPSVSVGATLVRGRRFDEVALEADARMYDDKARGWDDEAGLHRDRIRSHRWTMPRKKSGT